jgi:hypothetical protein
VLVQTDQAESTKGKRVVVSNQLRTWMVKPRNPEPRVRNRNELRKQRLEWKPASDFLIEKYTRMRRGGVFGRLGGISDEGHHNRIT